MIVLPGPKCKTQGELEREMKMMLGDGIDSYVEKRKETCGLFWKYVDGGASERIWARLKDEFLT